MGMIYEQLNSIYIRNSDADVYVRAVGPWDNTRELRQWAQGVNSELAREDIIGVVNSLTPTIADQASAALADTMRASDPLKESPTIATTPGMADPEG